MLGVEFALITIIFIFSGFYIGSLINKTATAVCTVTGATLGFAIALRRLIKKVE